MPDFNNWQNLKPRQIPFGVKRIPGIQNVIACASGKGGVGKSTTTVALAYSLSKLGAKVGILDCDVHGPNIACLMGAKIDNEQHDILDPVMVDDIATQSIAYWVDNDVALAWRGAMVTKALLQMAYQTRWPELDILLLDLPPETGDVALSICKKIPLCAAFLVVNAHQLSFADAIRANNLFTKCKIPVVGVIDNMQLGGCEVCGHVNNELAALSVGDWAAEQGLVCLGGIPFTRQLHSGLDLGNTVTQGELGLAYQSLAASLQEQLYSLPRDYSSAFGVIREEKSE